MTGYRLGLGSLAGAVLCFVLPAHAQTEVGLWHQYRVEYSNPSWSGNPFDVELSARFEHTQSGRTLRQFGFYAGNNVWKLYFMPDRLGEWSFATSSPDPELNGQTGTFNAVASGLPGRLEVDGIRWRLSDGGSVSPVLLAAGPFIRTGSLTQLNAFADWAQGTAGALVIGTTLLNFAGDPPYTESQADRVYEDSAEGSRFYLPAWDRSNEFYDMLRDRRMGHYIMLYADDASAPNRHNLPEGTGGTLGTAELRLLKYLVARFGAYPIVMWDSGIDIGEYRSNAWIDSFVAWFAANDPWQHPIGSRNGGGSGGRHPGGASYYSDGERTLPGRSALIGAVEGRNVATAMSDRYRENFTSPFDGGRAKIRRAAWQMLLTYGTAVYFGGSENAGYLGASYASDLEAAGDLGQLSRFAVGQIADLGSLVPDDALVSDAPGEVMLARSGNSEYVAYILSGDRLSIALENSQYEIRWYDPINGQVSDGGSIASAGITPFYTPGTNSGGNTEWVLHLKSPDAQSNAPGTPAATPSATTPPAADESGGGGSGALGGLVFILVVLAVRRNQRGVAAPSVH